MSLQRFSSRRASLYDSFLSKRLEGAQRYDRIAGYFQSSLLELAAESYAKIPAVRVVCNSDVNPADVHAVRQASGPRKAELTQAMLRMIWNQGKLTETVDVYGEAAKERFRLLQALILGKDEAPGLEIRIVPDCEFGFLHGKAGVFHYADGRATSFIGSANDSERAWMRNYELVWEDERPESVAWVQEEFDALWSKGFPISEFIVKQIGRLGTRTLIQLVGDWREQPDAEKVLAEVPTCTELFGFWDHQKYFIHKAFEEHKFYADHPGRGARYLLCDGVGLGKTLQLGGLAKLIGSLDDDPILILAPKAVVNQWQDELVDKLAAPNAVWTGKGWLTERDEFHPASESEVLNCPRKIAVVPTSVILSANRSLLNGKLTEELLRKRFSCVLWDEAHKIRRANVREPRVWRAPEMNLLYRWAMQIAERTRTLILATATPVQLHPIELWDLLRVLSVNNPQVLGSETSRWRDVSQPMIFDILTGKVRLDSVYAKWEWWRDPLPAAEESEVFRMIRAALALEKHESTASNADFDQIDPLDQEELETVELREMNPFTQRIIKRTRDRLEAEGKLVKIELVAVGDDRPVYATHNIQRALELAEEFSRELHQRMPAAGFIKTLLQRRVGSSIHAGLLTAERMLANEEVEDESGMDEEGESIYPLTEAEGAILRQLRDLLQKQMESEVDPKFERVSEMLESRFSGGKWADLGVLIFSQYYDSAYALCRYLSEEGYASIGLYANSSSSKLFENGEVQSVDRELLKAKVKKGVLKILVGTDAASTGLNLQRLGALINLDLPWNPTILEQRKGRVQRGTIGKRIPFCNLRYNEGVEQRLFNVLTGRIQEITNIFGTIPDFITEKWVEEMLENKKLEESDLVKYISDSPKSPFALKETKEQLEADWEATSEVLNAKETTLLFMKGW